MDKYINNSNNYTPRENFLMVLLNKVINEYKSLLNYTRGTKPFKIIEIIKLSNIPGETQFLIQITNKNSVFPLTAAEIINNNYDMESFSEFHSQLIKQAAQGKLVEFLKLSDSNTPKYKILSKKFDRDIQQNVFVIEDNHKNKMMRTSEEIARDKKMLSEMDFNDIYDIGYTQVTEFIIKEKTALLLAKNSD